MVACGSTNGNLFSPNEGPNDDGFVVKLDSLGNALWSGQFGTTQDDGASGVAVDDAGMVYVCGYTKGGIYGANLGASDAFLVKFAAAAELTMSPDGGAYSSAQSVTIACSTEGATIRYTTDGSEPTETSTQYTAPVTVDHSLTLKAKAWKTAYIPSYTKTAEYVIE